MKANQNDGDYIQSVTEEYRARRDLVPLSLTPPLETLETAFKKIGRAVLNVRAI